MTNKLFIVLKHEFLRKVKSRAYIILTLIGPLLFLAVFALPVLFSSLNQSDNQVFAVIDETGKLGSYFLTTDSSAGSGHITYSVYSGDSARLVSLESLRRQVDSSKLAGILYVQGNAITGLNQTAASLRTRNVSDFNALQSIEHKYKEAVRLERLKAQGLDPSLVNKIENVPDIQTIKVTAGAKEAQEDSGGSFIAGYVTGFIIYMSLLLYGTMIMRSVIEEKGSRIIEVIVSSVDPYDLLLGKVLGNALAAFLQVAVWAILLGLLATVGVSAFQSAMGSSFHLSISPYLFLYFVLYFVLGFLIFATLYAAVGATVDQDSDAQQASIPITLLVMIPILTMTSVIQAPSSTTSVILSLIPFFSPVLMMGRIFSETPPLWQIALSIALMLGTFFGVLWLAARVYRVGILMYGKRFSLPEVMKWLRYS